MRVVTAPDQTDAAAQILLDAGCNGVQVDDSAVQRDDSEDATIVPTAQATVTGYLPPGHSAAAASARLETARLLFRPPVRLEVETIAEADWDTNWKQHFPPMRIGRFLVVPPWDSDAATASGDALTILIDPGFAFGTGQHPTTAMCLELLGEYLSGAGEGGPAGPRVLDVGCGSGILSIGAAHLGARVTASDLDAFCTQAARDNAVANHVGLDVVQAAGLDWTADEFDVVLANLTSTLLVSLASGLARATRPGGLLIVSGISAPRAADVEAALHAAEFTTVIRRDRDGEQRGDFVERWTAFVLRK